MDRTVSEAGIRQRAAHILDGLSERESEVAVAVARGMSNAEIAADLYLSVATVKAHVSNILTKLDLDNRTQLAVLAHDAGVV
jgi:DNA-binding NarL/FixJ family response regulator